MRGPDGGGRPRAGSRCLSRLASPGSDACRCLALFQHVTAVGATHWDVIVPFCTATVCAENPFDAPNFLWGDLRSFWRVDAALGFEEGSALARSARGGEPSASFAAHVAAGFDAGLPSRTTSSRNVDQLRPRRWPEAFGRVQTRKDL